MEVKAVKAESVAVTSRVKAGQVAQYGAEGALTGDAGLTFKDGVLTAAQLGAFKATGPVDFNAQPVTNLQVTSGEIAGVSLVSTKTLKASGALEVGLDASVSGDLVVSGSVSGSGSYHDISDGRFKRHVKSLQEPLRSISDGGAMATLRALRGVSFEFRNDTGGRPVKAFPRGTQFGFIAQEVEQVLPQVGSMFIGSSTRALVDALTSSASCLLSLRS